jgi:glycosyltransferase involved in cell wall biosynthesis
MRILIATEFPPDAAGGGAAIVRQMLTEFPVGIEIFWWSVLPRKRAAKGWAAGVVKKHFCGASPGKLMPQRKFTRLKAWLLEHLWASFAANDFKKTLKEVRPDCVWVIPHNWSILPIHEVLVRQRYPARYHVSIHDYVDVHGFGKRFGYSLETRIRRQQDEIYKNSETRDAICQSMADDMERLTGKRADFICRKGVSLETLPPLDHSGRRNGTVPIRIAYAGTVVVHEDFKRLTEVLDSLRESHPLELHLYGAHDYGKAPWFGDWMEQHGNLNESELTRELSSMDWGISLMALGDHDPSYNRYSFPAKFSTYLAAGLPVITIGHRESSVVRMALEYNVGVVLDKLDHAAIVRLEKALIRPKAKEFHRSEIFRCAREQFDELKMRRELISIFRKQRISG